MLPVQSTGKVKTLFKIAYLFIVCKSILLEMKSNFEYVIRGYFINMSRSPVCSPVACRRRNKMPKFRFVNYQFRWPPVTNYHETEFPIHNNMKANKHAI